MIIDHQIDCRNDIINRMDPDYDDLRIDRLFFFYYVIKKIKCHITLVILLKY